MQSETEPGGTLPATVNNGDAVLHHALDKLSLGTPSKTPLPPSPLPRVNTNRRASDRLPSSPGHQRPPPSPLRRTSSTMDVQTRRSDSPGLARKSSSSSLRSEVGSGTPARSRRSSNYMVASSPITTSGPGLGQIEEKETVTAATVAAEYFKRDLERHDTPQEKDVGDSGVDTVVLLHDSCYGHRFSRPKTTKTTLSLIVERPERILAGALGVSAAYVRLGERYEGGRAAPHPTRQLDKNIPFRIIRTQRAVSITSPVVTAVHGTKWMEELKVMCEGAAGKLATTGRELSRPETNTQPGQPAKEKLHEGDLYLCQESLDAFQGALGGVLDGVDAVFEGTKTRRGPSRAFVCIRPPGHHCSADYPSGFCWLNNVHVGIQHAASAHGLTHAAIIDFDLHHGDGSQTITWAHNARVAKMPKNTANSKKTAIGYFSLHDINSYPCEYGEIDKVQNASLCIENAHGQSIWNVHLQPWKTEADFWDLYETRYKILLDKTRAFLKTHTERLRNGVNQPQPKAAIFLSAGFDASEWESPGMQRHKVNVPTDFYARFTRDVVQLAQEEGTGTAGRVISVLEGGYSDRALASGVLSHLSGLCQGQTVVVKDEAPEQRGLGYEIAQRMGSMEIDEQTNRQTIKKTYYDTNWWKDNALSELEALVNPPPVVTAPKKRNTAAPTYSTPTQSFVAKVVDPAKVKRNSSSSYRMTSASPSRAPTPHPPEVDWATAAHELSKLLIPSDRQTKSCKPEDLNEPKIKKEKPAPAPITASDVSGRQLRGRKAAKPGRYADPETDDDDNKSVLSAISTADRRATIATLPTESSKSAADTGRRASRRLSVASSIGSVNGDRSSRAPSVASTRPTSTATSRAPSVGGVNVKKARGTAVAKADAASRPAVPRVPSGYGAKAKPTTVAQGSTKATGKENNDVDALTTGMKKITLKLPPKNEYEAKQREKEEAEKEKEKEKPKRPVGRPPTKRTVAAPKAATKSSTVAKKSDSTKTRPTATTSSSTPKPSTVEPTPTLQISPPASTLPEEPKMNESSAVPATGRDQPVQPASTNVNDRSNIPSSPPQPSAPGLQFVHYEPEGRPTATPPPNSHPQTLQWLPPNSDAALISSPVASSDVPFSSPPPAAQTSAAPALPQTSSSRPSSKGTELPVFTSNGTIPFGSPSGKSKVEMARELFEKSPPRATVLPKADGGEEVKVKTEQKEGDIWKVPDTPRRD